MLTELEFRKQSENANLRQSAVMNLWKVLFHAEITSGSSLFAVLPNLVMIS